MKLPAVYDILMFTHLMTVVPCIFLGAYLLLRSKGTKIHRLLGKINMSLMVTTALISLFMPALVSGRFLNHFGWIHLFSALTLWTVPSSLYALKKKNIRRHKTGMILLYVGAIVIAGGFTLAPGRYLNEV
ncbi:MAG: DUF2306 domain-containing protein, partial [Bacteroidota bacterium]|nr:DUF2306 domain-containing protein [Bacteroidota bacterium]